MSWEAKATPEELAEFDAAIWGWSGDLLLYWADGDGDVAAVTWTKADIRAMGWKVPE